MAVIQKGIKLAGSKGESKIEAVFGSGASYSCIQPQLAQRLGMIESLPEPMNFASAKEGESLAAEKAIRLDFYLIQSTFLPGVGVGHEAPASCRFSDEFMLIPGLSEPVIIGAATLNKWRLKLNFETDEVMVDPRVTKLRLLMGKLK